MEDRRVDGVRDDDRVAELDSELAVLLEREPGLQDRRGGQLGVDPGDAPVGAVVEAAIGADRAVDAVHHPRPPGGEATEPLEVEVERIEQTRRGSLGDALPLHVEAAALELAQEGTQELVPAAGGSRRELVEERQIGPAVARAQPVALDPDPPVDGADPPARRAHDAPGLHGDTLTSRGLEQVSQPGDVAVPSELRLHGDAGVRAEAPREHLILEDIRERPPE